MLLIRELIFILNEYWADALTLSAAENGTLF